MPTLHVMRAESRMQTRRNGDAFQRDASGVQCRATGITYKSFHICILSGYVATHGEALHDLWKAVKMK